jgi:L-amino acid N-acyltransferase YncA
MAFPNAPPSLNFRSATAADWPLAVEIVAGSWDNGDYIEERTWQHWIESTQSRLIAAEHDGKMVAFCRLQEIGPAEWWLHNIQRSQFYANQGVEERVMSYMIELFLEDGHGILRSAVVSSDENGPRLLREYGFRHTVSYAQIEASARPGDPGSFRLLKPANLDMAHHYLLHSPMHRVNKFAEHYQVLFNLTRDRLESYLADPAVQVIGWRQFEQLLGLAVLFLEPPIDQPNPLDALHIGYLDAPDDTTLIAMLSALRGLAARRELAGIVWRMPLGVGLETPLRQEPDLQRVSPQDLQLYERPFSRIVQQP